MSRGQTGKLGAGDAGRPDAFAAVHAALRAVMLGAAPPHARITRDLPGDLEVRLARPAGAPGSAAPAAMADWFGTVAVKKAYVSYHLMPLYARPTLADGISPALAKRRQGKTCFNFARADSALFAELAALTRTAADAG